MKPKQTISFFKLYLLCLLSLTLCNHNCWAQDEKVYNVNLFSFYTNKIHYGFSLGYIQANFNIQNNNTSNIPDTLIGTTKYAVKSIYANNLPGISMGLCLDLKIHQYVRLRFTPNYNFANREIEFNFANKKLDSTITFLKRIESALFIFPIDVKIQSKRSQNFSAYFVLGGGMSVDLNANPKSQRKTYPNQIIDDVKVNGLDFFYDGGAGADFYFQYFKFGMEIKLMNGLNNILQKQNNVFTNSINSIYSQMWLFTLTFEG